MNLWHYMIILHVVCALASAVSGVMLLSPGNIKRYPNLFKVFTGALVGMVVFMVFATVSHWSDLSLGERIVFSLLPFLGLYMLYRGRLAIRRLREGNDLRYVDDVGFALIPLLNGFVIVGLMDLRAPAVIIVVAALAAVYVGTRYTNAVKRRLAR